MKVFHDNDPDGCSSAYLVYKAHQNKLLPQEPLELFKKAPKEPIDVYKIYPDEHVYIIDTSINPKNMRKLLQKTQNVFWIDHHISSMRVYEKEGLNPRGLRDLNYSSCENTFRFLFGKEQRIPEMISLVGDFDLWRPGFRKKALPFVLGIQTESIDPIKGVWEKADQNPQDYIDKGHIIYSHIRKENQAIIKKAFPIKMEGFKGLALNTNARGSLVFDEHPEHKKYDFLLIYSFNGSEYGCSIYSQKFDMARLASKYGGGGHKAASGFRCKELPFEVL